jgi:hypothetical protein
MSSTKLLSDTKRKLMDTYRRGNVRSVLPTRLITPRPEGAAARLSLSQEQLVLREMNAPCSAQLYNECVSLRMRGPLDVPALEKSLVSVIERHEIWRTSYELTGGQLSQIVHRAPREMFLEVTDLRLVADTQRQIEEKRTIERSLQQPFDLKNGPLLRFNLIRFRDAEYKLFVIAHLSVLDGVSAYQIWPSELAALYLAYSSGRLSLLPALPIQFGDYAYWQRNRLQDEERNRQLTYWRQRLGGLLPVMNWRRSQKQFSEQRFCGGIRCFCLPGSLSEAVKSLSKKEGVTLFVALLATFVTLLFAYTEQQDIIVGTPSPAGRKLFEVGRLLGYFLNPVALRFDLTDNPTFRSLMRQAQRLTIEAISNDDVPLEWLVHELQGETAPHRGSLFSVAMSLQPPMPKLDLDWSVTSMDFESGGSPWDLYVAFIDKEEGIMGRVQFNTERFEETVIVEAVCHFQRLLEEFSLHPENRLSEATHLLQGRANAA